MTVMFAGETKKKIIVIPLYAEVPELPALSP